MIVLVDTERLPQHAIDKAASSILTDRTLPYARASWQQCTCCDEWNEDPNIEYTFTCTLGASPSKPPTPTFQLKTRHPAYTCPGCVGILHKHGGALAGDSKDGESEAEQLCPLHVQAVYVLDGSDTADNMAAIFKGFYVNCPDCKFVSRLLKTPAEVRNYVQQHLQFSKGCIKLKQALVAGTYDSPAAFGTTSSSSKGQPEKVILEVMSRLVVMTACHIVSATRPPPTPIDRLSGKARRTAAATAHIRSSSKGQSTPEGQQLLPYRWWAVDALSLDSELLTEANWVRPSLAGLALEHKPSLLDLVLAPPYIAVAEHDAGMTVDKLAVLLLREQQQHKNSSLHRLATAGADQLPAAVAAAEAALSKLLSADAVFKHTPVQQRMQQFLDLSGIPGLGDVVCALAQPHVAGRGPQNRHLAVCAVCGMTPAALQRAKRSYALHRCKYCIVSTCQSCRQEQQEQQQGSAAEAAESDELCLWCQGHPDTQDLDVGSLPGAGGKDSGSSEDKQQKRCWKLSSPDCSVDQAASAAAAVLWDVKRSSDSSLGTPQQQAGGRPVITVAAAPAGAEDYGDTVANYRSPHDYDIVVELAAASRGQDDHDSQLVVSESSKLQQEMEDLQRLQAELQSAVECLGIQGLQLPLAPATPLQPADGSFKQHRPSPCVLDASTLPSKRQKVALPMDQPKLAAQQADSATADGALAELLLSSAGFTPLSTAASLGQCKAHTPALIKQAGEAAHMLADAGFTTISHVQCLAGKDAVQAGRKAEAVAGQQKPKDSQAAREDVSSFDNLLKSLDHQIDVLCADISDWCSSNLAADHADVDKTLQVIQQCKQQLWHNHQQTGQQLFINGLEILGEIVGAFTALPAAGAKVVLACNIQRRVSGACCPDNQSCSVLELIMSCWFKEMEDSGVTGVATGCKDTAIAAGGSPGHSSDLIKQQQVITSGRCHAVLRLIAQLSALQHQVYYGPLAAGAELQEVQGQTEVAAALRDAVMYVISGTALLMLHDPEAGLSCSVASSSKSKMWGELAAQWQQCLFKCKWAVANKFFNSNDATSTAMMLAGVVKGLERIVSELLALKESHMA